jgi:hypothetical protein
MSMKQAICDQKMWFWAQSTKHEHEAQSMSTKQRQKNWALLWWLGQGKVRQREGRCSSWAVQCTSFDIDGGRRKQWVFKRMTWQTKCKTLNKFNKNAQHNVIVKKWFKKLNRALSIRRTAIWLAAAGTTEFLNCLPQKGGLKTYYHHGIYYHLWQNVIVHFALRN